MDKGICTNCRKSVEVNEEPITVSGWYGSERYRLVNTRAVLVEVLCDGCKEAEYTARII